MDPSNFWSCHIHSAFDADLAEVNSLIARMGTLALEALERAMRALAYGDLALARQVREGDRAIDELQAALEAMIVRTIALRGPMADDLRTLIVAIKIGAQLERAGDHAKSIAKQLVAHWPAETREGRGELLQMGRHAAAMLEDAVSACARRDCALAVSVRDRDPALNRRYVDLSRRLLGRMREEPELVEVGTRMLLMAKKLERVGDYAANISDSVHYMVTGSHFADWRAPGTGAPAAVAA